MRAKVELAQRKIELLVRRKSLSKLIHRGRDHQLPTALDGYHFTMRHGVFPGVHRESRRRMGKKPEACYLSSKDNSSVGEPRG